MALIMLMVIIAVAAAALFINLAIEAPPQLRVPVLAQSLCTT